MKISVIIPIYNVEKYIKDCIESVIYQTYNDLEIILVDDGSPDNCPQICDQYAKIDQRIIVIHKKNGGLSDARNVGIRKSTGEYVIFLDGDDLWDDKEAMNKLVKRVQLTKPDVLNYTYKKFYDGTEKYQSYVKKIESMSEKYKKKEIQLDFLTRQGLYIASACNKMIRRKLFADYPLYFEEGVFSEDIEWCARILIYASTFDFIYEDFYCYRQRENSIRHTISDKNCTDLTNNILKCLQLETDVKKEWKDSFYSYIAFQYGTFFLIQAMTESRQKGNIERLKNYSWLLSYHRGNKKLYCLHYLCKIIGYTNTCRMIRIMFHRK